MSKKTVKMAVQMPEDVVIGMRMLAIQRKVYLRDLIVEWFKKEVEKKE